MADCLGLPDEENIDDEEGEIHLVGTIAGAPVHMSVAIEDSDLDGYYYYDKYQENIAIEGFYDSNLRKFTIYEYSEDGEVSGVITGTVRGEEWNGTYHRAKDSKEFKVNLKACSAVM